MVLEKKKQRYSGVNKGHEHGWCNICYLLKYFPFFLALSELKKKGKYKTLIKADCLEFNKINIWVQQLIYKNYKDCIFYAGALSVWSRRTISDSVLHVFWLSASLPGIFQSIVNKTNSAGLVICLARLQVSDNPACHHVCFVKPGWQEKGMCNPLSVDPLYLPVQLCRTNLCDWRRHSHFGMAVFFIVGAFHHLISVFTANISF